MPKYNKCLSLEERLRSFVEDTYVLQNLTVFPVEWVQVGSHWAECMVLSRLEDHEYDASFANARAILPDTVATVDDMAASGRPYMAMATLMYAPRPLQKCLIMGDVNRHSGQSSACSLASLQQELKSFPTLWLMLVTAIHGQDAWSFLGSSPETGTIFSHCLTCFD